MRSGNPLNLQESIDLFQRAVALDPAYLAAWLALAHAYIQQCEDTLYVATLSDAAPHADRAIHEALKLDPGNGRGMGLRAWIMVCARYEFEQGLALFEQARVSAPNDTWIASHYALLLNWLGDARAEQLFAHAYRLDPLDPYLVWLYAIFPNRVMFP